MDPDEKRKRKEKQAREHPIRAAILKLYAQDEGRSLAAKDLTEELGGDLALSIVAYHVRVLQTAKLLPVPERA